MLPLEYIYYGAVATCTRTRTVPARRILFEIKYGTRTVQYSTVQYSTVQYSTVQYSTVQYSTVQYSYNKYKQERGLSTVHCGTVPVP